MRYSSGHDVLGEFLNVRDGVLQGSTLLLSAMQAKESAPHRAIELFQAAANCYISAQKWRSASYSLKQAGELLATSGELTRANRLLEEARALIKLSQGKQATVTISHVHKTAIESSSLKEEIQR